MRLVLLIPDKSVEFGFYDNLTSIALSAAESLGHDVRVLTLTHYDDREHWDEQLMAQGRSLLNADPKPDYVILPNYLGIAERLAPILHPAGIQLFVVAEHALSRPGIVGQLVPDDVEAGELLGRGLLRIARERLGNQTIEVAALGGDHTGAGRDRFNGWHAVTSTEPSIRVVGFQYAVWSRSFARDQTKRFLRRCPNLSVIWAASDSMAVGACDAAKDAGRRLGEDLFIGGIDFDRAGLASVRAGEQSLSLGGHILDGARALVALHEKNEGHPVPKGSLVSPWFEADAHRAGHYFAFISERRWQGMNFRQFTRAGGGRFEDLTLERLALEA